MRPIEAADYPGETRVRVPETACIQTRGRNAHEVGEREDFITHLQQLCMQAQFRSQVRRKRHETAPLRGSLIGRRVGPLGERPAVAHQRAEHGGRVANGGPVMMDGLAQISDRNLQIPGRLARPQFILEGNTRPVLP